MKKLGIILIAFLGFGCSDRTDHSKVKKMDIDFICSFYKNDSIGTIEFSRIVKDSINFNLIEGKITFDENYNTNQEVTTKKIILESDVDSIKSNLQESGFRENFDNYGKIIFVQMQPKDENDLEVLDIRHTIEEKISDELGNKGIGTWVAGDLGPGGANMLFKVSDWDNAIKSIIEILNAENLLNKSLIIKRLNTAEDDWNYEIVYPIDFSGTFNQM